MNYPSPVELALAEPHLTPAAVERELALPPPWGERVLRWLAAFGVVSLNHRWDVGLTAQAMPAPYLLGLWLAMSNHELMVDDPALASGRIILPIQGAVQPREAVENWVLLRDRVYWRLLEVCRPELLGIPEQFDRVEQLEYLAGLTHQFTQADIGLILGRSRGGRLRARLTPSYGPTAVGKMIRKNRWAKPRQWSAWQQDLALIRRRDLAAALS